MWTWKKQSFWFAGALVVALGLIYFWTHPTPSQPAIATYVQAPQPTLPPKLTSTDWSKCLDGTATPDKTGYTVLILNKCPVTMDPFFVRFKFYDASDARIGWDSEGVSSLEPSEKVKWKRDYPAETYPLTKDGVARIQVFDYSKGSE